MANCCEYEMKVKGTLEAVQKFIRTVNRKEEYYFYRIGPEEHDEVTELEDGRYSVTFYGDCAWSVNSSWRHPASKIDNLTCLDDFVKENNLEIEVWSCEPGCCFAEHLAYILDDNGELCLNCDDCFDYEEDYNEDLGEYEVVTKPVNFWNFEYI